jgi:hypothetical protein
MTDKHLELIAQKLGEALHQVEEQKAIIKQQEAKIRLLEARLAQATSASKAPPARPWQRLEYNKI